MGKKRIVLKVTITDKKKCKKQILSAVGKIAGIDKLDMDADKGTLTVVGEVEPVPIFKALKKIGKSPEIVNVGPPRPVRCGPHCSCSSCSSYYDNRETWWQQSSYPSKSFCNSDCNKSCCKQPYEIIGYPVSPDYDSGKCAIM